MFDSPQSLLDAMQAAFPLFSELEATEQDPEWHREGNVLIHTRMVVEETFEIVSRGEGAALSGPRKEALLLAAALHDIAKPLTTRCEWIGERERIIAPRHAEVGRSYLLPRLFALGVPYETLQTVARLVGHHHDPGRLLRRANRDSYGAEREMRRLSRQVDIELVTLLELADMRGRRCPDRRAQIESIEFFQLLAEDAGVWRASFYESWLESICEALADELPRVQRRVFAEACRDHELGLISTPDEAVARSYGWRAKPWSELILTFGPSGSGKSRWVEEKRDQGWRVVSLDGLRAEVGRGESDQRVNGQVIAQAREALREALRQRERVIWDATNLRRDTRARIVRLGLDYDAFVQIVAFHTPLEVCQRRNQERERSVPVDVLRRQFERAQYPTVDEVHSLVWSVDRGAVPPQNEATLKSHTPQCSPPWACMQPARPASNASMSGSESVGY